MRIPPLALLALPLVSAGLWSCDSVKVGSETYDLSSLKGTHSASKETETPPTKNEAMARFDICNEVKKDGDLDDEDNCPAGSRACLLLINHKPSQDPPGRVTAVIPLWKGEEPEVSKVDDGIELVIKSGEYAGTRQRMDITFKCADKASDPSLESYTDGILKLVWSTPAACAAGDKPAEGGSGDGESDGDKKEASGMGFFGLLKFLFWTFVIVLIAYFVIGIAYNHQTYSARGWDLVPHRDFWRELPSLTADLGQHLVANVRQSTGRGGYSSLG